MLQFEPIGGVRLDSLAKECIEESVHRREWICIYKFNFTFYFVSETDTWEEIEKLYHAQLDIRGAWFDSKISDYTRDIQITQLMLNDIIKKIDLSSLKPDKIFKECIQVMDILSKDISKSKILYMLTEMGYNLSDVSKKDKIPKIIGALMFYLKNIGVRDMYEIDADDIILEKD